MELIPVDLAMLTQPQALTISAFLLLLIDYVADSAHGHKAENAIARKVLQMTSSKPAKNLKLTR
jgi:hypothetical protein